MTKKLYKEGITVELAFSADVALYKSRGFVEVKENKSDEPEPAEQATPKKATQRKKEVKHE